YKEKAGIWHDWDRYFPLLHYRVMTMTKEQLNEIHGVDEGIEGRIIEAMKRAENFNDLLKLVKTKRYTQVRLQRMFVHILTNTTKKQMEPFLKKNEAPYIRLLGMTENGRAYLNRVKKALDMPLIVNLNKMSDELYLDERALRAYYSILPDEKRLELFQQEFQLPIIYP
ncbi:MAG: nucleotidyltransferase, partial [Bacilli bacterium]|nr:nucleotidyltransferase [Bacilli bacterium]